MDKFTIDLPRVYKRGPPPRVILNRTILQKAGIRIIPDNSIESAYAILKELYVNKQMSLQQLGALFNVQHETIKRWLKRLKIPIRDHYDSVSYSLSKHKRVCFSGDLIEAAYMIGLRYGDISTQKHGRNIRLSVTTSHPSLLNIFEKTFNKYGKIRTYPKQGRDSKSKERYLWSIYCDVNNSFNFLLNKLDNIPEWVIDDKKIFLSFLAGYFDAEGCICTSYGNKRYRSNRWIIQSYDKKILSKIRDILNTMHINLKFKLAKKANHRYNQDLWCIDTGVQSQILELTRIIPIKHEEKLLKVALFKELLNNNKNGKNKVIKLRNQIKNDVIDCMRSAEIAYNASL